MNYVYVAKQHAGDKLVKWHSDQKKETDKDGSEVMKRNTLKL